MVKSIKLSLTSLPAKIPNTRDTSVILIKIKLHEDYISYLFTINYDSKNDKLMYIVDSDIMTTDTIWITTEFFGLALSIGKDDEILIKYNEKIYTERFRYPDQ